MVGDEWNAVLADAPVRGRLAASGEGLLADVPVSVKDNLAVAGWRMTCGSRHLEEYVAPYTATVVERLVAAGARVVAKTNMDEFGAGSSGENSAFGPTLNPRDAARVPGGSSSGAAATVAGGLVPLALGSDTGGSARCPAAFCGVAALKPSYGLLSRYGLADLAMSLEAPAPIARDVATLARAMDVMAGPDVRDPTTTPASRPLEASAAVAAASPESLRVGVPREFFEGVSDEVARPVRDALARLEARGATVSEVRLPSIAHALSAYYVLNYAEFASAMSRYDGVRFGTPWDATGATRYHEAAAAARATFGPEVKRRILLGTFVTSREARQTWYEAAVRARAQVAREFAAALEGVDVLMGPTMPVLPWRRGERVDDPRSMYAADILTVAANLAGVPAGSVPVRAPTAPVGLQVIGAHGTDARVLAAMRAVEAGEGVVA